MTKNGVKLRKTLLGLNKFYIHVSLNLQISDVILWLWIQGKVRRNPFKSQFCPEHKLMESGANQFSCSSAIFNQKSLKSTYVQNKQQNQLYAVIHCATVPMSYWSNFCGPQILIIMHPNRPKLLKWPEFSALCEVYLHKESKSRILFYLYFCLGAGMRRVEAEGKGA